LEDIQYDVGALKSGETLLKYGSSDVNEGMLIPLGKFREWKEMVKDTSDMETMDIADCDNLAHYIRKNKDTIENVDMLLSKLKQNIRDIQNMCPKMAKMIIEFMDKTEAEKLVLTVDGQGLTPLFWKEKGYKIPTWMEFAARHLELNATNLREVVQGLRYPDTFGRGMYQQIKVIDLENAPLEDLLSIFGTENETANTIIKERDGRHSLSDFVQSEGGLILLLEDIQYDVGALKSGETLLKYGSSDVNEGMLEPLGKFREWKEMVKDTSDMEIMDISDCKTLEHYIGDNKNTIENVDVLFGTLKQNIRDIQNICPKMAKMIIEFMNKTEAEKLVLTVDGKGLTPLFWKEQGYTIPKWMEFAARHLELNVTNLIEEVVEALKCPDTFGRGMYPDLTVAERSTALHCPQCNKTSVCFENFRRSCLDTNHTKWTTDTREGIICEEKSGSEGCGKSYTTKEYMIHRDREHGFPHNMVALCSDCKRKFLLPKDYLDHGCELEPNSTIKFSKETNLNKEIIGIPIRRNSSNRTSLDTEGDRIESDENTDTNEFSLASMINQTKERTQAKPVHGDREKEQFEANETIPTIRQEQTSSIDLPIINVALEEDLRLARNSNPDRFVTGMEQCRWVSVDIEGIVDMEGRLFLDNLPQTFEFRNSEETVLIMQLSSDLKTIKVNGCEFATNFGCEKPGPPLEFILQDVVHRVSLGSLPEGVETGPRKSPQRTTNLHEDGISLPRSSSLFHEGGILPPTTSHLNEGGILTPTKNVKLYEDGMSLLKEETLEEMNFNIEDKDQAHSSPVGQSSCPAAPVQGQAHADPGPQISPILDPSIPKDTVETNLLVQNAPDKPKEVQQQHESQVQSVEKSLPKEREYMVPDSDDANISYSSSECDPEERRKTIKKRKKSMSADVVAKKQSQPMTNWANKWASKFVGETSKSNQNVNTKKVGTWGTVQRQSSIEKMVEDREKARNMESQPDNSTESIQKSIQNILREVPVLETRKGLDGEKQQDRCGTCMGCIRNKNKNPCMECHYCKNPRRDIICEKRRCEKIKITTRIKSGATTKNIPENNNKAKTLKRRISASKSKHKNKRARRTILESSSGSGGQDLGEEWDDEALGEDLDYEALGEDLDYEALGEDFEENLNEEALGEVLDDEPIAKTDAINKPMTGIGEKKSLVQIMHDPCDKLHKQQTVVLEKLSQKDLQKYIPSYSTTYFEDEANNLLDVAKKIDLIPCEENPYEEIFKSMMAKMEAKKPKVIEEVPISTANLYKSLFAKKSILLEEQYSLNKQQKKELPSFVCSLCKEKFSSRYDRDEHIMEIHISPEKPVQPKEVVGETLKGPEIITIILQCNPEDGATSDGSYVTSEVRDNVKDNDSAFNEYSKSRTDKISTDPAFNKYQKSRNENISPDSAFEDQNKSSSTCRICGDKFAFLSDLIQHGREKNHSFTHMGPKSSQTAESSHLGPKTLKTSESTHLGPKTCKTSESTHLVEKETLYECHDCHPPKIFAKSFCNLHGHGKIRKIKIDIGLIGDLKVLGNPTINCEDLAYTKSLDGLSVGREIRKQLRENVESGSLVPAKKLKLGCKKPNCDFVTADCISLLNHIKKVHTKEQLSLK